MTWIRQSLLPMLLMVVVVFVVGCGPAALGPGNTVPKLQVAGWTNGAVPTSADLEGKVVVLEVFATW